MAEVPAEDLYSNFDISLLDQHLYSASPNYETKSFEDVINEDVSLNSHWMNKFVTFSQNESRRLDFAVDDGNMEVYSDTESQLGGSSAVPSPAIGDHNKSFEFLADDKELTKVSVKELNKMLKSLPKADVDRIKRRRRTLKNRRYAHSCRMKRLHEKSTLETTKEDLESTKLELQQQLQLITEDRDLYKAKYNNLLLQVQLFNQRN